MLDNLKSLLRARPIGVDEAAAVAEDTRPDLATVTPLEPRPLPSNVGDMSTRAEAAIDELSETLRDWFESDLRTLFDAWQRYEDARLDKTLRKDLFHAAHNLSGMGDTYGEPEVGRICRSLCRLIKTGLPRNSHALANLHVDACRAIGAANQPADAARTICEALEAEVKKLGSV